MRTLDELWKTNGRVSRLLDPTKNSIDYIAHLTKRMMGNCNDGVDLRQDINELKVTIMRLEADYCRKSKHERADFIKSNREVDIKACSNNLHLAKIVNKEWNMRNQFRKVQEEIEELRQAFCDISLDDGAMASEAIDLMQAAFGLLGMVSHSMRAVACKRHIEKLEERAKKGQYDIEVWYEMQNMEDNKT